MTGNTRILAAEQMSTEEGGGGLAVGVWGCRSLGRGLKEGMGPPAGLLMDAGLLGLRGGQPVPKPRVQSWSHTHTREREREREFGLQEDIFTIKLSKKSCILDLDILVVFCYYLNAVGPLLQPIRTSD